MKNLHVPICPYCKYEFTNDDVLNLDIDMYVEQNEEVIECPYCHKQFFVTVQMYFNYITNDKNSYEETVDECNNRENIELDKMRSYYEKADVIGKYETLLKTPADKRLTHLVNGKYLPKYAISIKRINDKYKFLKKEKLI